MRRNVVLLLALAALVACSDDAADRPVPAKLKPKRTEDPNALIGPAVPGTRAPKEPEPEPITTLSADIPGRAAPQAAGVRWTITARSIGTLSIGAVLHEPARGFEGTYTTSYYADGQPLEGFALDDPPVLAAVSGGPFRAFGAKNPGVQPSEKLRADAIKLARAGKLTVDMIVIVDPRPKTELGIGVREDYLAFEKRYPALPAPSPAPALWEEPSCITQSGTITFFFDRCDTRAQAKLIRIVVRKPAPSPEKAKPKRKRVVDTEF